MFSVRVIKCFASSVHVEWRQRGTLKLKRVLPTKVTSLYDLRVKVFRYTHCQHDSHFLPPRWGLLLLLRSHKQKTPRWTNPKTATMWGSNHNWKKTKNKSNILSSAFWSVYQPKQVLHLNTKNAFIFFPFVHFFSNKTGQIWIIWNASCAVWLYCYNPSCSCFVLFLKRHRVSEWWRKQQRNERDLTSPPSSPSTPASEMVLLQERCCKGIFQGGKKHVDTEKIIPGRSKAYFICAWHSTHTLFLASKSDEGLSGTWNFVIQQVGPPAPTPKFKHSPDPPKSKHWLLDCWTNKNAKIYIKMHMLLYLQQLINKNNVSVIINWQ